jgi:hypothetical protein
MSFGFRSGRVHGAPELSPVKELLAADTIRVDYRARSERRRCRSSRRKYTRLKGQDKSNDAAAVGSAHYYLISRWDCTGCDGTARGALVPVQPPRGSYETLFSVPALTSRFFELGFRVHSTAQAGKEKERRVWRSLGEQSSRVLSRFRDLARSSRTRRRRGCPCPGFGTWRPFVIVGRASRRSPSLDRREGYSRAQIGYAAVKGDRPYFRHDSFTEFSPTPTREEWHRARRPL